MLDKSNWTLFLKLKTEACSSGCRNAALGDFVQTDVASVNKAGSTIVAAFELTFFVFERHPELSRQWGGCR